MGQPVAEPLAIWQPFGLHPFFACIFDFGGDPSSKGGAGRLRKSSDCVLEYFFEISLLMFFFSYTSVRRGSLPLV